jgi:hypothetical protein
VRILESEMITQEMPEKKRRGASAEYRTRVALSQNLRLNQIKK